MEGIGVHNGSHAGPSRRQAPPATTKRARSSTPVKVEDGEKEESPAPELDELYVAMRTDVVGVQYYTGMVGKGEYVMLRRQPDNQYDPYAVQVRNASGRQVGHVPRAVASNLAPLMDENLITVEGRMIGQNLDHSKHFKLAMELCIYARPSHRAVLEPMLVWATPGGRGFEFMRALQAGQMHDPASQKKDARFKGKGRALGDAGLAGGAGSGSGLPQMDEEVQRLLNGLKRVSEDEKHAEGVMDSLTADIDASKLPLHPSPPGLANGQLLVDILPHQSQALQWMISRERPRLPFTPQDPAVQFWVKQKGDGKTGGREYWLNVATRTPQSETPVLGKGGIIADGMGLGKTLAILSLVLATKKTKAAEGYSEATLIVCPLSVLSNWEKQINDHIADGQLTFYTYHGAGKGVTPTTLSTYDVVLTTYQTIAAEAGSSIAGGTPSKAKKLKTSAGPLSKVKWKRVVADEGHVLKNPRAKMTQAFAALQAECRWVCTGTPIVNSPADLGSLLTCLQLCKPLDQAEYFKSLLLRPLKNGDQTAAKLLQALVGQILLRRTKETKDADGKRLVELPPIEYFQVPVQLDPESRHLYDEVLEASARRFQQALRTGEPAGNVLSMLTRLRQLCLSKDLIPSSFLEDLRRPPDGAATGPSVQISTVPNEKRQQLVERLQRWMADKEGCAICLEDTLSDPRITDCGHAYCNLCISHYISVAESPNCPYDRHPISLASLLELPPEASEFVELDENATSIKSAKISELVKYLKVFDPTDKTLVFSQFTSFLDHVAAALREEGIAFCRFDGSMNAKQRTEVISAFQAPVNAKNRATSPVVMLISLKSGAVGLNLTAASNVFLCDPWWQSAIEAQAIDRVHRMGQRKTVRVFQLIAEETIESKVLEIQKRKDALVAKAFEKSSKGETAQAKRQARFEDLKELFGVK